MDDNEIEREGSKIIIALVAYILTRNNNIKMSEEEIKELVLKYKTETNADDCDSFADRLLDTLDNLVTNN